MKLIDREKIKEFLELESKINDIAHKLAEKSEEGFGRKNNSIESIEYTNDGVYVVVTDFYYDLRDEASFMITWDEIIKEYNKNDINQ